MSCISVLKGKRGFHPFYLVFFMLFLHGNKGYIDNSYSSLIINYHASKCTVPNIATIRDNSTDDIKEVC